MHHKLYGFRKISHTSFLLHNKHNAFQWKKLEMIQYISTYLQKYGPDVKSAFFLLFLQMKNA